MRKIVTFIAFGLFCLIIFFFLWDPSETHSHEEDHHDHDHHHHDEDFVHITQEQCEYYGIKNQGASAGQLTHIIRAPAQIVIASNQIAHILPRVSGIALHAYKNIGETVSHNELIAILESKEIAEVKANYFAALKKEELASSMFEREKVLHEKKISAEQDYLSAKNSWEDAKIQLELTKQRLLALGLNQEDLDILLEAASDSLRIYELRSPMSGQVISRHIVNGELVTADQEIYVIADLSKVWAEISIFSKDRPYAKQGQLVTITSNDGNKTPAKITYISPIIDQNTRTSTAIAEVENKSGLWLPGTLVHAELISKETPIPLMITKESVQEIDGNKVVFIPDGHDHGYAVRPIVIGQSDENHYEVVSGLNKGDEYACTNTFLLKTELKKEEAEHVH